MCAFGIFIFLFDPFSFFVKEEDVVKVNEPIVKVDEKGKALVNTLWETNSVKSDDYVGTITFESGLIDLLLYKGKIIILIIVLIGRRWNMI